MQILELAQKHGIAGVITLLFAAVSKHLWGELKTAIKERDEARAELRKYVWDQAKTEQERSAQLENKAMRLQDLVSKLSARKEVRHDTSSAAKTPDVS
jgi:hypothetical protein